MEIILNSIANSISIKTCYFEDSQEFATCLYHQDGTFDVLETFKSPIFLVDIHDFWCKFTGITKSSISIKDVLNHVQSA